MKRSLLYVLPVFFSVFLLTAFLFQPERPVNSRVKDVEQKVAALLASMSLEEKIGQMTQVTIDVVSVGSDGRQEPHALDAKKLETALLRYHVGSIINVGPSAYSVEHWHEVITQIQDLATKKTRLGIPVLYGIDAIHGASYTKNATLFPQPLGLASTWNASHAKRVGEITSFEVRASGIPWNFYPVMDIGRQPLWPRLWETYGEDVHLAVTLGTEYIRGAMGNNIAAKDKLAPCLKHYAGYSYPLSGKDRTPAWIDERTMREYFLTTFEAGIKAGVPTVMVNSGEVNGIPGHANYHLLTEVLKEEWKFGGFTVSDWEDIKRLYTRDKVATSPKEAVRMAVMAGIDMSMVPLDYSFYDLLLELVNEKSVPMSRIDDAVGRILRVKTQLGLFDNPYPDKSMASGVASREHTQFNKQVAGESVVLLKNTNALLPLQRTARVLVTGPTANMLSALNGGWTITWQGDAEELYPKEKPTILKAIQSIVGKNNVVYVPGSTFGKLLDVDAARRAAETSDVIIACLGEPAYCETPGNINDLTLDEAQLLLVEELAKSGKPIIVVLTEGRPRIIRRIVERVHGIVVAFLPGMEGGSAIAGVLFGDVNPSGRLPLSYPKYPHAIVPYDCKVTELVDGNAYDPQFPFGFGLSYTTFEYSNLRISHSTLGMNGSITVAVDVRNSGSVRGKEVVQLYVSDLYRSVVPHGRQLKGFEKIDLERGETKTVEFVLRPEDLSFIGTENKRIVEPGTFRLSIGTLTAEFQLQ